MLANLGLAWEEMRNFKRDLNQIPKLAYFLKSKPILKTSGSILVSKKEKNLKSLKKHLGHPDHTKLTQTNGMVQTGQYHSLVSSLPRLACNKVLKISKRPNRLSRVHRVNS